MSELVDMGVRRSIRIFRGKKYDWYSARYMYEDSACYKREHQKNQRIIRTKNEKIRRFLCYSRKFADFAGLFMFFATPC